MTWCMCMLAAVAWASLAGNALAQPVEGTSRTAGARPGGAPDSARPPSPPPAGGQRPPPGRPGYGPGGWPGFRPVYPPGWGWTWGYAAAFPWWGVGAWLPYGLPRAGTQTIYVNPEPMPTYGGTGVTPPFVAPGQWYCPSSGAYYPQVNSCQQPWMEVAPVDPMPPPQAPAPDPVPGSAPTTPPSR